MDHFRDGLSFYTILELGTTINWNLVFSFHTPSSAWEYRTAPEDATGDQTHQHLDVVTRGAFVRPFPIDVAVVVSPTTMAVQDCEVEEGSMVVAMISAD